MPGRNPGTRRRVPEPDTHEEVTPMVRKTALITLFFASLSTTLAAQATGLPSFNAPYRAFERDRKSVV